VKNEDMKQYLLIIGERALGEYFKQTLKIEAVKVAARLPAKLCVVRAGVPMGTWSPVTKCHRTG
jgi:hypothetical protein